MREDSDTTLVTGNALQEELEGEFEDETCHAFQFGSLEEEYEVLERLSKVLLEKSFEKIDPSEYMEKFTEKFKDYVFERELRYLACNNVVMV
jgi:hypothetical protein